jgi:hypothetical protein
MLLLHPTKSLEGQNQISKLDDFSATLPGMRRALAIVASKSVMVAAGRDIIEAYDSLSI